MKIDFVIPWVDGSDPEWIREKNRFIGAYDQEEIDALIEKATGKFAEFKTDAEYSQEEAAAAAAAARKKSKKKKSSGSRGCVGNNADLYN